MYCRWFVKCENPAIGLAAHPVFTAVPICYRCAMGSWAWTRPDFVNDNNHACLMSVYQDRTEAIQTMLSLYDELREWWESDGENWRLMYSAEVD